MIISKTPLRITFGGGGTDIPSYYERNNGGFLVSAAINKYVYVSVHESFTDRFILKYSKLESQKKVEDLEHPLVREALKVMNFKTFLEISSLAEIPAGTGLGSSGTFTVGLLKALNAYNKNYKSNIDLAKEACHLEIDILQEPVGKQDQYISALGGLTAFEFKTDGTVKPTSVKMQPTSLRDLEDHLLLFYTGLQRSASDELAGLNSAIKLDDSKVRDNLNLVKESGYKSFDYLVDGNLESFAQLLTDQWKLKFERSPNQNHKMINSWIEVGLKNGALGGKLIGAGQGGFLLFFSENNNRLRIAMKEIGLKEIIFGFDYDGAVILR